MPIDFSIFFVFLFCELIYVNVYMRRTICEQQFNILSVNQELNIKKFHLRCWLIIVVFIL